MSERWIVTVDEGADKVSFLGSAGRFIARPFRGAIHRELALGLRSLEVPSCRNQLRPGWTVGMPEQWEARDNRDRKLIVFGCPNVGITVLEFFTPVAPELERALVEAFGGSVNNDKEQNDGSEEQRREQRRSSEAGGEVLSLAAAGGPAGEGQRGGHGEGAGQPDQPEGERLTPSERQPAWAKRLLAKMPRGRR